MATTLPIGRLTEPVDFLSTTPPAIPVTTLTALGMVASAVTGTPHGFTSGDYVAIRGAVPLAYNTTSAQVTVTGPNTFSYGLAASIGGPAYQDVVLGDAPAHYWRLSETSGLTAADLVGGHHGTISGGVLLNQPGALADGNAAMAFDGVTGIVMHAVAVVGTTATIEWWMKPAVVGAAYTSLIGNPAGGASIYYQDQHVNCYAGGDQLNTTVLPLGVWRHVVIAIAAGAGTFYVNGVIDGTFVGWAGTQFSAYGGGNSSKFTGALDEVAIYPHTLTAAAILAHYQAASGTGGSAATGTITATFKSDSQGGQPDDWYAAGSAFAYIEPLNASERQAVGGAAAATVIYRAVVHYRPGLEPHMILHWTRYQETAPRELEIFGVFPHPEPAYAHRFLVLECGELE